MKRSTIYRFIPLDKQPKTLNTDKHSSYANVIALLKKEKCLRKDVKQRQVKYLNNGIESEHPSIKKLMMATSGFEVQKRACATIQGVESVQMLNKGQFDFWLRNDELRTIVRDRSTFINGIFNVDVIYT